MRVSWFTPHGMAMLAAAAALIVGGCFWLADQSSVAAMLWGAGVVPALLLLLAEIEAGDDVHAWLTPPQLATSINLVLRRAIGQHTVDTQRGGHGLRHVLAIARQHAQNSLCSGGNPQATLCAGG